ncbi:GspE/PulE family protein [Pseudothermotoga thermarum]|uniref:Type II secretion system protein E n=1 Tax=Pseudothermotoga thermarum DSM 5069 TaxID=688269 RepID=F7YUA3_9THEM|nr:GspE/PulE family protein [Pseudothermotoga thermarum]AEH51302.1 type II secretion system protein E [Pseudothermotoga thermarum DSM 5069]
MAPDRIRFKRLGEILLEKGLITQKELQQALEEQKTSKKPLGEILVEKGYVTWDQITQALSEQYGIPVLKDLPRTVPVEVLKAVPRALIDELRIIPIGKQDDSLIIVTDTVYNYPRILSEVKFVTGKNPIVYLVTPQIYSILYAQHIQGAPMALAQEVPTEVIEVEPEAAEEEVLAEADAPIVRLVNTIIQKAVEMEASDIHIEPFRSYVRVRYRIDGLLRKITDIPKNQHPAIVTRIKIMSGLDISEKRLPQDGKFYINIKGEQYDFRVSTMPSVYGEKVAMRILKVSGAYRQLEELGYSEHNYHLILKLLERPHGIILVTGPTGSGKSTTLVAMINKLKDITVNIMTVEDPVEYTIDGVTQCQVNPEIGLTFARFLRSFLRQDPDIIMIGEMRDKETAALAIEASLTGHLVLSTLHTNSAAGAIDRLVNMGIDRHMISTALIGVISQRLVRKLCDSCKIKVDLREDYVELWKQVFPELEPCEYVAGPGCAECGGTGYKGRVAVAEVLMMDREIKELVVAGGGEREIYDLALRKGMRPMFIDGFEKVLKGITSFEEVLRVTVAP